MNNIRISTMVTDINNFDPYTFQQNSIGIEIQTFPQHILDDGYEELIEEHLCKLRGYNGIVSLYGSSFDLNPDSTDEKIIEVTKYRYLQSIGIGKTLGASYIVFHSQVNPLLKVKRIKQMKLNNQVKFWNDILKKLKGINMILLPENEYDDNYEDLLYLIENINSDKIKICLDIGHALVYSKLDLKE